MEIRLATLNDIDAICPLLNEFFAYNAGLAPMFCKMDDERGDYPKSIIESSDADFLIAVENGIIRGFVHISQMKTPPFGSIVPYRYAEIIGFMVTEAHRGKGIGTKLMDAAKEWSNARNLDYIELAVMANSKNALEFYEQKDFSTTLHIMRHMSAK
ncbi:MAG: GNAT family N-acetyltransferase [Defluviitaleaceae bacterium]|nr:GNAT family N-acetyltransferase [Defluviitaleaceae bacterium]